MDLTSLLQVGVLAILLLCPLSMIAMWAWSRRRTRQKHGPGADAGQSAANEAEVEQIRAELASLTEGRSVRAQR